ncbi:MAG TPA: SpoIIE family protein phosphatase [Kofleriaceae bacterium]|nr:SpoIIE family protein phosphatase [Kofleriaceae bacterium]
MTVVEWACSTRALHGQITSGDRGLVLPFDGGALAVVIDGLGHGPEAGKAAECAEAVIRRLVGQPLADVVRECHEACKQTRGVVLSIALFDDRGTMSWLGVGNVEALLIRGGGERTEAVASRGGTVGYLLPPLNPRTLAVQIGDTLVLASDGIKHGFKQEVMAERSVQQIADEVLAQWAKDSDDACALVARYVGVAQDSASIRGGGSNG